MLFKYINSYDDDDDDDSNGLKLIYIYFLLSRSNMSLLLRNYCYYYYDSKYKNDQIASLCQIIFIYELIRTQVS